MGELKTTMEYMEDMFTPHDLSEFRKQWMDAERLQDECACHILEVISFSLVVIY